MQHTPYLVVTTYHGVELAVLRILYEVAGKALQVLVLLRALVWILVLCIHNLWVFGYLFCPKHLKDESKRPGCVKMSENQTIRHFLPLRNVKPLTR